MRYSLYTFLFFAGIAFQLAGCSKKTENSVKISIHYPKSAGDTIVVGRINMIDMETVELGKVRLDSAGKGNVEVQVEGPVFAFLNGKNFATGILIGPGERIGVVPAPEGSKLAVQFEGDGAAVNRVLNESQQVRQKLEKWSGNLYFQLEANEFFKAKDSLQRSYDQLFAQLKTDKNVSAEKLDLLRRQAAMHVVFYQYNFAMGKDSSEIPASIRNVIENLPIDTIALKAAMFDYSLVASQFYQHQVNNAVYQEYDQLDSDSLTSIFPLLVEKKIKDANYPKLIEDFIRAKSADVQIALNGLSPNVMKVVNTLEKEIASEEFKKVIRGGVAAWEKLGPGKPAPDFAGMTPDGKKLALSDLRGKVVYVDIWATWCGPCVGEFPDSKKVQAEFKDNEKVAFLYVSVDRDTLAWKKMVAGNKVPKGLHMLNGSDTPESIWKLYQVWGIPRYLLIDAEGRMVAAHAQRPSSGNIQAELRKLLTSSRVAQK